MIRKTIFALVAASIVTPAFAQDTMNASQRAWVSKTKACLVANKVEIAGDRPQCYISTEMRIRCLTPALGAIAAKCNSESLPGPGARL